ncbi:hypothetical protein EXIGLDRAFT_530474 [Exidia glandulosa HHB12029]|uniref:Uncharacterized protein n=1 Tax=Exidia glandulosa HHB12029 TaxID=1314781 RepID=A0A166MWA0_EXIGL|nr:hypothetical protein EXIGLDRAFT_530474 [Exidia glandulosa HHB12029]
MNPVWRSLWVVALPTCGNSNFVVSVRIGRISCPTAEDCRERSDFGRRAEPGRNFNHLRFAHATRLNVIRYSSNGYDAVASSDRVWHVVRLVDGVIQAVHRHVSSLRSIRLRKISWIRDPPSEIVERCPI